MRGQAGAFSCGLHCEEHLLLYLGWNTRAVVADSDFHAVAEVLVATASVETTYRQDPG
jgi:hypothetical protein